MQKFHYEPITDEEIERVRQATAEADRTEPRVNAVRFESETKSVVLSMRGGATLTVPLDSLRGFENATTAQLENVRVFARGSQIEWPDLEEAIEMTVLIPRVLGVVTSAEMGRRGGSVKSPAKALAATQNGAKGGRPRKKVAA